MINAQQKLLSDLHNTKREFWKLLILDTKGFWRHFRV